MGYLTSETIEYLTIDSGACDSIAHPTAFANTPLHQTPESGKQYGACGGETVTNMGEKTVKCLTRTGKLIQSRFQVGNKITKNIMAVSQLCSMGYSVVFGPGPQYDAYICTHPDTFVCCPDEDKIPINLHNGVYVLPVRELISSNILAGAGEEDEAEATPSAPSGAARSSNDAAPPSPDVSSPLVDAYNPGAAEEHQEDHEKPNTQNIQESQTTQHK